MTRHTAQQEKVGQDIDDIGANAQRLSSDMRNLRPSWGAVFDEVVGPHVVRSLGSKPNAGPIVQPKPTLFGLPDGDLQPMERGEGFRRDDAASAVTHCP
jgi:hypothetical protein